MDLQASDRRVQKFLDRHLRSPAWQWQDISDPRGKRGRRRELKELLNTLFLGHLSNCPSLRDVERYRGKTVCRRLYRSAEIAGYHGWQHLRQLWLVEQDTVDDDGGRQTEQRFFLTNLHVGRLSSGQILALVRMHWRIEDDCFWSLDVQWKEDSLPWCTVGPAVEILGLMRMMAYNLVQLARTRSLRPRGLNGKRWSPPAWRSLFRWIQQALRLELEALKVPLPA